MRFYHYLLPGAPWGEPLDWDDATSVAIVDCDQPISPPTSEHFKQVGQLDGPHWYMVVDGIQMIHDIRRQDMGRSESDRDSWSRFALWDSAEERWTKYFYSVVDHKWTEVIPE